MQDTVPETIVTQYQSLPADAEDCIACGSCENRCPFGVLIVQGMEEVRALHMAKSAEVPRLPGRASEES